MILRISVFLLHRQDLPATLILLLIKQNLISVTYTHARIIQYTFITISLTHFINFKTRRDPMKKIIRAIDLGYGQTKYTKGHMGSNGIPVGSFPSIAPVQQGNGTIDIGLGQKAHIHTVTVNNIKYHVGKDTPTLIDNRYSSPTHYDYTHTNEYLALNYGALLSMGVPVIDQLVVGLPVHLLNSRKKEVEEALTGELALNNQTTVTIKSVKVVPQPMGGFFQYLHNHKLLESDEIYSSRNLVIDPGYFTYDWIVTNGVSVNEKLSGAVDGGMSEILNRVSSELEKIQHLILLVRN